MGIYEQYWYAWDFIREPPIKNGAEFEDYVKRRKEKLMRTNMDWLAAVTGSEGTGKSQFGVRLCQAWDNTFLENMDSRIVYDVDALEDLFEEGNKGISILVDEAVLVAYSRASQTDRVTRFIESVIRCRYQKDLIVMCIPQLKNLDTYLREHRLRTVFKCMGQGKVWAFGKTNYPRLIDWENRFKLPRSRRPRIHPRPNFRYYPAELKPGKSELWDEYIHISEERKKLGRRDRKEAVESLTSGDIAKMYGVTPATGWNYLQKIKKTQPEALITTPSGQLRLKKSEIEALESIFPRKS